MAISTTIIVAACGFAIGCYVGYRLAPKAVNPLNLMNPLGWL